jgi:basic amino acid/polyamine antiporter, APA family
MARTQEPQDRSLSLLRATSIGVGAIVGGGILALAGSAFASSGPAAILAFALNGVIAMLTALTFAEMASKFPESGGTYAFSRKVLSVEAAFIVGWVVWFASVAAAVLYAIGFAHFGLLMLRDLWILADHEPLAFLDGEHSVRVGAILATVALSIWLTRSRGGPSSWVNILKVGVFALLLVGGAWAFLQRPISESKAALTPFFDGGSGGLLQAMGFSFIALQGFDLIAAVGGEVKDPVRNLPRAMIGSLSIALILYLPLLFFVTTVGTTPGESVRSLAASDPEGVVSAAATQFLGPFGYWLVTIAAVLAMFTALQANLFAASRIANSMARDRTLPGFLRKVRARNGNPANAIYITAALVCVMLLVLPDVGTAGAAASLIFLVTFAMTHVISILVRQRSTLRPPPFRTRWFPLVPVVGGLACVALAVFQGVHVPQAGSIAVVWMGLGGILFLVLFARGARVHDALTTAIEPELVTLRGNAPLVLVPIANPGHAHVMISLADAMVPANVGRVLLQAVLVVPQDWDPEADAAPIERLPALLPRLLAASSKIGIRTEMLTTVARDPMAEIARVTRLHRCESVVLGLSQFSESKTGTPLELLLGTLDADVVIVRARGEWSLQGVQRILIPVGGEEGHEHLMARILGSLSRFAPRETTFVRVVPTDTPKKQIDGMTRDLEQLGEDVIGPSARGVVLISNAPAEAVAAEARKCDLLMLGVQRIGRRNKVFGRFTRELASKTECPLIVISRRG